MKAKMGLVAIAVLVGGVASAAPSQPASILDLFKRIPEPPATVADAAKWYDKTGKLVQPAMISVRADLEAHKQSIRTLQEAAKTKSGTQQVADMSKTMAGFGIDMSRMNDPAYAKEVQQRMKQMSPQEMMAISRAAAQPAARPVQEPPQVDAAVEAVTAYQQGMIARIQAQGKVGQDTETAVERITSQSFPAAILAQKPRVESDCIGDDGSCEAQWKAYAQKLLPLMIARDGEILAVRRAAYLRERDALSNALQEANRHLVATQYGAAAQADQKKLMILGYDEAMTSELEQIIDKLEEAAHRAAITMNCGDTAVTQPITCR